MNSQYYKDHSPQPRVGISSRLVTLLNAGNALNNNNETDTVDSAMGGSSLPRYTDEDVRFLEAAREVVSLHKNQIDPTIRDILNRLQYANSPHGGFPISREYLDSINNDSNNESDDEQSDDDHKMNFDAHNDDDDDDNDNNTNTNNNKKKNNNKNKNKNNNNHSSRVVSPFHNNRNSDTFPHMSLDIFKTDDLFEHSHLHHHHIPKSNTNTNFTHNPGDLSNLLNDSTINNLNENIPTPIDLTPTTPSTFFHNQVEQFQQQQQDFRINGADENKEIHLDKDDDKYGDHLDSSKLSLKDHSIPRKQIIYDGAPRNFLCETCGLSFKRSSDLKRHEKIHLEVPPNLCPNCKKRFARKDALKRHINTLTCKRNRERLLKSTEKI